MHPHVSQVTRIAFVNNGAIRRHFHDLTTGLLRPLQRFTELGPDGWLPVWDPAAFLQYLKATQAAAVPAVVSERWVCCCGCSEQARSGREAGGGGLEYEAAARALRVMWMFGL